MLVITRGWPLPYSLGSAAKVPRETCATSRPHYLQSGLRRGYHWESRGFKQCHEEKHTNNLSDLISVYMYTCVYIYIYIYIYMITRWLMRSIICYVSLVIICNEPNNKPLRNQEGYQQMVHVSPIQITVYGMIIQVHRPFSSLSPTNAHNFGVYCIHTTFSNIAHIHSSRLTLSVYCFFPTAYLAMCRGQKDPHAYTDT